MRSRTLASAGWQRHGFTLFDLLPFFCNKLASVTISGLVSVAVVDFDSEAAGTNISGSHYDSIKEKSYFSQLLAQLPPSTLSGICEKNRAFYCKARFFLLNNSSKKLMRRLWIITVRDCNWIPHVPVSSLDNIGITLHIIHSKVLRSFFVFLLGWII